MVAEDYNLDPSRYTKRPSSIYVGLASVVVLVIVVIVVLVLSIVILVKVNETCMLPSFLRSI